MSPCSQRYLVPLLRPRLHHRTSHRRIQSINNAPVTCNAGSLACSSTPLGPFPTLRAEVCYVEDFDAKLLVCHVHFPSSPTMSLRSEDAETTKSCQVSLMFREGIVKVVETSS
jgi:hypothetical protein